MKNSERVYRTLHVINTLDGSVLSGLGVAEARANLEKASTTLAAADADELAKATAVKGFAPRLRDACTVAFDECLRARSALVVADPHFAGRYTDDMVGRTPRKLLAKAFFLLQHGTHMAVGLGALAKAREELALVEGERSIARVEASVALDRRIAAQLTWDAAYAALRGAVSAVLAGRGARGKELVEKLHVCFPVHVTRPGAEEPQPKPPGPVA